MVPRNMEGKKRSIAPISTEDAFDITAPTFENSLVGSIALERR